MIPAITDDTISATAAVGGSLRHSLPAGPRPEPPGPLAASAAAVSFPSPTSSRLRPSLGLGLR